jgi:DNA (cytosine-5)-methyltransferase 1
LLLAWTLLLSRDSAEVKSELLEVKANRQHAAGQEKCQSPSKIKLEGSNAVGMPNWEDRQTETETPNSLESVTMANKKFEFYEFFAGGGMARLGLGSYWDCTFANEWSEKKASAYRAYFGRCRELRVADVAKLGPKDLPGSPDLVWASFPCQDLSLAGAGAGLDGERSGTFRPFWRLIEGMAAGRRAPGLVVVENVVGTLTSHSGDDFTSIVRAFVETGYRVGALVIDAVRFLPQSRPRLFIVGLHGETPIPSKLRCEAPSEPWHTASLIKALEKLPVSLARKWVWWSLPTPKDTLPTLESVIEERPTGVIWHAEQETRRLLRLMAAPHRKRVEDALRVGSRHIGTIYKRTRPNRIGQMAQRAEVRFDGISGCLRTPVGGSSRQTVIIVNKKSVRTRLLSPREAARLMGVPDDYPMPTGYNDAYHVFGDGVAVPVVRWLEKHLLRPLAACRTFEQVA